MAWLATVAPYDTITSLWGNTVRDRTVQTFASIAERNANNANAKEGMVAWADAENTLAVWSAGAWAILSQPWQGYSPQVSIGGMVVAAPLYYRAQYQRTFDTVAVRWDIDVTNPNTGGGQVLIGTPGIPCATPNPATLAGTARTYHAPNTLAMWGGAHLVAVAAGALDWITPYNGAAGPALIPSGFSGGLVQLTGHVDYPAPPGTP